MTGGGVKSIESEIMELLRVTRELNAPAIASAIEKWLRTIQRYIKKLPENSKIRFKGAPKMVGYFLID